MVVMWTKYVLTFCFENACKVHLWSKLGPTNDVIGEGHLKLLDCTSPNDVIIQRHMNQCHENDKTRLMEHEKVWNRSWLNDVSESCYKTSHSLLKIETLPHIQINRESFQLNLENLSFTRFLARFSWEIFSTSRKFNEKVTWQNVGLKNLNPTRPMT